MSIVSFSQISCGIQEREEWYQRIGEFVRGNASAECGGFFQDIMQIDASLLRLNESKVVVIVVNAHGEEGTGCFKDKLPIPVTV